MDDADAAEVLALTIALDPYGYGNPEGPALDALIDAWTLAMPDVDADLAKRAVIAHYRASGKRISVADVVTGAEAVASQDRAVRRRREVEQRREADRAALPPAGQRRDRTADIAALLARHRNWDPIGDLATRRRQAAWSPALERAYREALRAKIRQERTDEPQP